MDPLGSQAPSINIYSQLLPGITNVTDRARYYSFYPWMVWTYERLPGTKTKPNFIEWVRRSDCLFTMIGIRHRLATNDNNYTQHEQSLIGSRTLHQVVADLCPNSYRRLSDFTVLDDGKPLRYFKNPFGGLKQYYIGTFDGLGLMTSAGSAVANTNEGGCALAEKMDASVDGKLFAATIQADEVNLHILDSLYSFCPCQLTTSLAEHKELVDLFFERNDAPSDEGLQRRNTLGLMLDLARAMARGGGESGLNFDQDVYRGCVYSGALPGSQPWKLPINLCNTQKQWRTYQKHELLSVAVQSIFWVALDALNAERPRLSTTDDFIQWMGGHAWVVAAAKDLGDGSFTSGLTRTMESLPAFSNWQHPEHEITLAQKALKAYRADDKLGIQCEILMLAGKLLLTLVARDDETEPAYTPISFPADYFALYPINLESLRRWSQCRWPTMKLTEWFAWVAGYWGIEAHLHVALRKLRYQNKNTFHVLPTDQGFAVDTMPEPTYTNPRFFQAVQILEDIGAITRQLRHPTVALTPLGDELWKMTHV